MIKATIISLSLLVIGPVLPLETPPPPPRHTAYWLKGVHYYPEPFGLELPKPPPPKKKVYRLQTKYFNQAVTNIKVGDDNGRLMKKIKPNMYGHWISAKKHKDQKQVWIYTPDVIIIEEL